jgi:hypothetical protein
MQSWTEDMQRVLTVFARYVDAESRQHAVLAYLLDRYAPRTAVATFGTLKAALGWIERNYGMLQVVGLVTRQGPVIRVGNCFLFALQKRVCGEPSCERWGRVPDINPQEILREASAYASAAKRSTVAQGPGEGSRGHADD